MNYDRHPIEIDIEVYRFLESRRKDFGESHNDILRRVLLGKGGEKSPSDKGTVSGSVNGFERDVPSINEKNRGARRTGTWTAVVLGNRISEISLKDTYKQILRELSARDKTFLDKLALQSFRSRYIVATEPHALYRNAPHLANNHAELLVEGWWVDTNLSRPQVKARVERAAKVAGIEIGRDLSAAFLDA